MRLGQLARKLALRPVEIIDFLAQHQIQVQNDSNAKLDDQHVELILGKFPPAPSEVRLPSMDESETIPGTEITVSPEPEAAVQSVEPETQEPAQKIELIKAPKIELSGLKVLGKIDLPEPKKKEPLPEPDPGSEANATEASQEPRRDFRKAQPRRERTFQPAKNPIALQREREAREAEKKRAEELERQKQKRTEYYQKRVKAAPPTKRVRLVDEPLEELSAAELVEPPRTWWGKFMRWLNT
jgi:hypothetical protein